MTQDEKTNILCSLLAKKNGAKRVIALVNQPTFVSLATTVPAWIVKLTPGST